MTDRELLELAAKAAGFGGEHGTTWTESEYPKGSGKNGALWNYVGHGDTAKLWNPLEDDGDALRLAVALRIDLHFEEQPSWCGEIVEAFSPMREDGSFHCEMLELKPDPNAATRRAIVRAAAEIGRRRA